MYFPRFSSRKVLGEFKKRFYSKCGCQAEELKDRAFLRVTGPDSSQLLQGLITNDIRLLENPDQKCLYTMFLNTKGRVLFDAFLYKTDTSFIIECDRISTESLTKHVKMYKLRKDVQIEPENMKVRVIFGSVENIRNGILCPDPRHVDLGYRFISNEDVPCGKLEGKYKELRYILGIAEGENEIPKGEMFPLEINLDFLQGVSFSKGCYLGQEVTSRTKHVGVVRKRLMPLSLSKSIEPNVQIVEKQEGKREKVVAKIKAVYGSLALGLIRIADLSSPAISSAGIVVNQPNWWPDETKPKNMDT